MDSAQPTADYASEGACTDTYTGANEGSWQTGSNWSTGTVPGSSTVACVPAGRAVKVSEGTNRAGTLEGLGALVLSGGTLEVGGGSEPSSIVSLTMSGGTLQLTGELSVTSSLSTSGSSAKIAGTGELVVASEATGTLNNSSCARLKLNGATLVNKGTLTNGQAPAPGYGTIWMESGAKIENAGTFNENSYDPGCGFGSGGWAIYKEGVGAAPSIGNNGTFNVNLGSANSKISVPFENQGSIKAKSGTINLTAGGIGEEIAMGVWTTEGSATLALTGGTFYIGESVDLSKVKIEGATVVRVGKPVNTAPPGVTGIFAAGQTLGVNVGGWRGVQPFSYTYQWHRCNAAGESCSEISGATAATYRASAEDVGKTLRVAVTASNSLGSASATSPGAGPVRSETYCTDDYTGPNEGAWQTASNWSAGVPGASSVACVPAGTTVKASEGSDRAGTLEDFGGLLIGGASVEVGGASEPSGVASLSMTGGTLQLAGELSVSSSLTTSGSSAKVAGTGKLVVGSSASGTLNNGACSRLTLNGATLVNDGALADGQAAGVEDGAIWMEGSAKLQNAGTFNEDSHDGGCGVGSGGWAIYKQGTGAPAITNTGTFNFNYEGSTSKVSVAFENQGTLKAKGSGTIDFTAGGVNEEAAMGTWSTEGTATLALTGGTFYIGESVDLSKVRIEGATVVRVGRPSNTKAPAISGIPAAGQTLSANVGTWIGEMPISYAYQWQRCNASGESCTNISGATGQTYKATGEDIGQTLRVVVSASNPAGSAQANSPVSAVVIQETSCTDYYSGPSEGNWQTATSWSTGAAPTASEVACLPLGTTVKVTEGTAHAAALQGDGAITLSGGTLEVGGSLTVGTSELSALTLQGGTLSLAGNLEVTSSITTGQNPGPTISGSAKLIVGSHASGTINNGSCSRLTLNAATIVNDGTLTFGAAGGAADGPLFVENGAKVENAGTFNLDSYDNGCGYGTIGYSVYNAGGAASSIVNTGTLRAETPTKGEVAATFSNSGVFQLQKGTLEVKGSGGAGAKGSWAVSAGAALVLNGGTYPLGESAWSGGGAITVTDGATVTANAMQATVATLNVSGGSLSLDEKSALSSSTLTVGAGSLAIAEGATVSPVATLTLQGGTLSLGANLEVTSSITTGQNPGPTVSGSGKLIVGAHAAGTINNASCSRLMLNGATLLNEGALTVGAAGGAADGPLVMENGAKLENTGTFKLDTYDNGCGYGALGYSVYNGGGAAPSITNTGTLSVEVPNKAELGVALANAGTLQFQKGTLELAGGGSGTKGTWATSSGAVLDLKKGAFSLAEATWSGAGQIEVGGASVSASNLQGSITNVALNGGSLSIGESSPVSVTNLSVSYGPLTLAPGLTMGVGQLAMTGGSVSIGGELDVNSSLTTSGLREEFGDPSPTLIGPGKLVVKPTASGTINDTSCSRLILSGVTFINQGSVSDGTASGSDNGPLYMENGAKLENTGTFNLDSYNGNGCYYSGYGYSIYNGGGSASAITNTGTFAVGLGSQTGELGVPFENQGTITGQSGTLKLTSGGVAEEVARGAWSTEGTATLALTGGTFYVAEAVDLSKVKVEGATVIRVGAPSNTAVPEISGTATDGETLHASVGTWTSPLSVSYAYQWQRCNSSGESCSSVSGATSPSYTAGHEDVGHTLRVAVEATNAVGSASADSAASAVVAAAPPSNTAAPAISGAAKDGQTLSAGTGSWEGTPTITYAYQWESCNSLGEGCLNIAGATESTYVLQHSDVGTTLRVQVTATNAAGAVAATSQSTTTVAALAPTNTEPPSITGTPSEGQTLDAEAGAWSGTSPLTYGYQWQRCDEHGEGCVAIQDATEGTYRLGPIDVGTTLRVSVSATNSAGTASAESAATAIVSGAGASPRNTAAPTISGTAEDGLRLSTSTGAWEGPGPISVFYQWESCNEHGEECAAIEGGLASSYALGHGDVGTTVRVTVTARNAYGSASKTSAASPLVQPGAPASIEAPTLAGTAQESGQLVADEGVWEGTPPISYAYQWQSCNERGEECANLNEATDASYALGSGDLGTTVRVVVTASNAAGSVSAMSEPSAVVEAIAPANVGLPAIVGRPQEGTTVSASPGRWTGPTPTFGYQWQRCDVSGAACTDIPYATGAEYAPVDADVGDTLRVVVSATNSVGQSQATSEASGEIGLLALSNTTPPSISGVAHDGQTLSASTGSWTGTAPTFTYQWERCNGEGSNCLNVSGATGSTYALEARDVGQTMRVVVAASNEAGSVPSTSSASAVVSGTTEEAACTDTWTGPLEGSWQSAADWSSGGIPGASDVACVGVGTTVTIGEGTDKAGVLRDEGTLVISGGSLELTNPQQLSHVSSLTLEGGTLTGPGSVEIATALAWGEYGVMSGSGATVLGTGATGTIDANHPCQAMSLEERALVNGGTISFGSGFFLMTQGATMTNSGTFVFNSESSANLSEPEHCTYVVQILDPSSEGALPSIMNTGTFEKTVGSGSSSVAVPFGNQGLVEAGSGRLELAEGGNGTEIAHGTWAKQGEASIVLSGKWRVAEGVNLSAISDPSAVEVVGSSPPPPPPHAPAGTLTVQPYAAGTVTISGQGESLGSGFESATVEAEPPGSGTWSSICDALTPALGGAFSCAWNTVAEEVPDGEYWVRAKLSDGSTPPNSTYTFPVSFVLDNTPPSGSVSTPSRLSGSQVVTGTASDEGSGVASWQLQIAPEGSSEWQSACPAQNVAYAGETYRCTVRSTSFAEGAYSLRAVISDRAGNTFTSTAAGTRIAQGWVPTISEPPSITGAPAQGQTLGASPGTWTGTTPIALSYQWQSCNREGAECNDLAAATSPKYRPGAADVGTTLRVRVKASNSLGTTEATSSASVAVQALASPANTVAPTIAGSSEDGETLTASPGTWSGVPTPAFAYQWQSCNAQGGECHAIASATNQTYTLTGTDVGTTMRVLVTATNTAGQAQAQSAASASVTLGAPESTAAPTIEGVLRVGETVRADVGSWAGTQPLSYTYQWQSCNASGEECANVTGATGPAYALGADEAGDRLRVVVTASGPAGSDSATSQPSEPVAGVPPANTALPVLLGTAAYGTALGVTEGAWSGTPPLSYAFQWLRCNAGGEACAAVSGATGPTYTPAGVDLEHKLQATVTATNAAGSASASSALSGEVFALAPVNLVPPLIYGAPLTGERLRVKEGSWFSVGSSSGSGRQWQRCNATGEECEVIEGRTGYTTYEPTSEDVGHTLRHAETRTTPGGSTTSVSEPTSVIASAPACTNTFTGASGGTWQVAENWSKGSVPTASDVACIGSTTKVEVTAGSNQVGVLRDEGNLVLAGGSLELSNAAYPSTANRLTVGSATLTGPASLYIDGELSWREGGAFAGSGQTVLEAGASAIAATSGCGPMSLDGRTFVNAGTLALRGTSGPLSLSEGARFQNLGVFEVSAEKCSSSPGAIAAAGSGAAPSFVNGGTFKRTERTSAAVIDVPFANEGTESPSVEAHSGTLEFIDGGVNGVVAVGRWTTAGSATIVLGGGNFLASETDEMSAVRVEGATVTRVPLGLAPRGSVTAARDLAGNATISGTTQPFAASNANGEYEVALPNAAVEATPQGKGEWKTICPGQSPAPSGAFACEWHTGSGSVADGSYELRAQLVGATSPASTAYSTPLAVVVDNTPPTGSVSAPGQLRGMSTVSGSASDTGSGVASWQLQIAPEGSSEWSAACPTQRIAHAEGSYRCALDSTKYAEGPYQLRAVITDNSGNTYTTPVVGSPIKQALPPASSAPPSAYGSAVIGQTLSATTGSWSGTTPLSLRYGWESCNAGGTECQPVEGASGPFYALGAGDAGSTLRVVVTASNGAGEASATSQQSPVVQGSAPPSNSEAPTLSGVAQVGQTLFAVPGTWTGAPAPSFSYQWESCDAQGNGCEDIEEATAASYTLSASDAETTVRVKITATNALGSAQTTSAASSVIGGGPPSELSAPTITGPTESGEVLHADAGEWGGGEPSSIRYQWLRCDVDGASCQEMPGATTPEYALTPSDVEATMRLRVGVANEAGSLTALSKPSAVISSASTLLSTAPPSISGNPQAGQVLTVDSGGWLGAAAEYAYQWERCNSLGGDCQIIRGATSASYRVGDADVGSTLRVAVGAFPVEEAPEEEGEGAALGIGSELTLPTAPIAARNAPAVEKAPSVTGTTLVGYTVSADPGTFTGQGPLTYSYQWERCNEEGEPCVLVEGAQLSRYTTTEGDAGTALRVLVRATDPAGNSTEVASEPLAISGDTLLQRSAPAVVGETHEGETLTVEPGIWSGSGQISFSYQWERCSEAGAECAGIEGATGPTYAPGADDVARTLRAVITATRGSESETVATPNTAPIGAQPTPPIAVFGPTIEGAATSGETMTAQPGTWAGTVPISFSYQWQRCNAVEECQAISGAISQSYVLSESDIGSTVRVLVTASNSAGSETLTSAVSEVVGSPGPPENMEAPTINGTAKEGEKLIADVGSWSGSRPLSYTYRWERCNAGGEECAQIENALGGTHVLTSANVGDTVRLKVSATNSLGSAAALSQPTLVVVSAAEASPQEAIEAAEQSAPSALAPAQQAQIEEQAVKPGTTDEGEQLGSASSMTNSSVSKETPGGFAVETASGELGFEPVDTSANAATLPTLVNGTAAVFAETQPHTDTIVRPDTLGATTILDLRSPQAPTSFSWEVSLGPDQELRQLPDGAVSVVEAEPESTLEAPLTEEALEAPEGPGAPAEPSSGGPSPEEEANEESGSEESLVEELPASPTASTPPFEPKEAELHPQETMASYEADLAALAQAEAQSTESTLLVMRPPEVRDAEGRSVPATLSVEGNTVTLTIQKPAESKYPMAVAAHVSAHKGAKGNGQPTMRYGLSDQNASAFDESEANQHNHTFFDFRLARKGKNHAPLHVQSARLILDFATSPTNTILRAWLKAVGEAKLHPFITLGDCVQGETHAEPCIERRAPQLQVPTSEEVQRDDVASYRTHFEALFKGLKQEREEELTKAHEHGDAHPHVMARVMAWGAWNEPDFRQGNLANPLAGSERGAQTAAYLWQTAQSVVWRNGCRRCTVTAGEFADTRSDKSYAAEYVHTIRHKHVYWRSSNAKGDKHGANPHVWGIHDYHDVIHLHSHDALAKGFLQKYDARLDHPRMWISEAGVWQQPGGDLTEKECWRHHQENHHHFSGKCARQTEAAATFLNLATLRGGRGAGHYERAYYYEYRGPEPSKTSTHSFDSGLLEGQEEDKTKRTHKSEKEPYDWRPAYCYLAFHNHHCPSTSKSGHAHDVRPHRASVDATVDPWEGFTHYWVEYGTTTAYGSRTAATGLPSPEGEQSVTVALTGLHCGTTYHYQVESENESNESVPWEGGDGTFTTPPELPGCCNLGKQKCCELRGEQCCEEGSTSQECCLEHPTDPECIVKIGPPKVETAFQEGFTGGQASSGTGRVTKICEVQPGATFELQGAVDPDGLPTYYHFEYLGEDLGWGDVPAASQGERVAAEVPLHGCESFTYRLVATNIDGTAYSRYVHVFANYIVFS